MKASLPLSDSFHNKAVGENVPPYWGGNVEVESLYKFPPLPIYSAQQFAFFMCILMGALPSGFLDKEFLA